MQHSHLIFHLTDVISLLVDAQRHILTGNVEGADRITASALLLLKERPKKE